MNRAKMLEYLKEEFEEIKKIKNVEFWQFWNFGENVGKVCKEFDCIYGSNKDEDVDVLGVERLKGWELYKSDGSEVGNTIEEIAKWYFEVCEGEIQYDFEDDYCFEFSNGFRTGLGMYNF